MQKIDFILWACSWAAVGLACLASAYSEHIKRRVFGFVYDLIWKYIKYRITHDRRFLRKGYFRKTRLTAAEELELAENAFDQPLGI